MLPETLEALEYDALRDHLARHSQSPLGRARALALDPSTDVARIRADLGRTTAARRYLKEVGRLGLGGLADPEPLLARLRVSGIALEAGELLDIARYIQSGLDLRDAFAELEAEYPLLASIAAALPNLARPLAEIRAKILPTGEVDESASPELRRIRREISRL
jgi:DNA mismatch repair protein MutS2